MGVVWGKKRESTVEGSLKEKVASFQPYPAWQLVHRGQLEAMEMQKLLIEPFFPMAALPLPGTSCVVSQVQCTVFMKSFACLSWHCRHAFVTSGPLVNGPFTRSAWLAPKARPVNRNVMQNTVILIADFFIYFLLIR